MVRVYNNNLDRVFRSLWDENGHSEYLTREEYQKRQLASMPNDYRKFLEAQRSHG